MKKISNLLMVIGIVMLIGTAGASDVGSIDFLQIAKQLLTSLAFIALSVATKKISEALLARRKHSNIKTIAYLGSVK